MIQKIGVLLLCAVGLIGCGSSKETGTTLNGHWQTRLQRNSAMRSAHYVLSFQDSVCVFKNPYSTYAPYKVVNDTLYINESVLGDVAKGQPTTTSYVFAIQEYDYDAAILALKPISEAATELLDFTGNKARKVLEFTRMQPKTTTATFESLAFYSSVCFGACPAMYVEVHADGRFLFHGKRYTTQEGWFSGQLNSATLQTLTELVQAVPVSQLAATYKVPYTDAAHRGILLDIDGKKYETKVYGQGKEPVALQVLFGTLMQLYQRNELTPVPNPESLVTYPDFMK